MQFSAKYEEAFKLTVGHEGGYQNRRSDRGNWTSGEVGVGENKGTKFGISAMSYPDLDIINISLDGAKAIYWRDYWDRIRGGELPVGLGYAVFDYAVNSGVFKASIELQRLVGAAEDGIIGPLTVLKVLERWETPPSDTVISVKLARYHTAKSWLAAYQHHRRCFVETLSGYPEYGRGWTRRINKVGREALVMIKAEYV
jgi:lysozyme family protein